MFVKHGDKGPITFHPVQGKEEKKQERRKSAYFFFMDDERPKQKEANPGASVAELAKLMGAEWNKIKGTAAAKKYEDLAAKDKTRYEKEKAAYEEQEEG